MIAKVLAYIGPSIWELLVVFIVFSLVYVVPIVAIILIIKHLIRNKKENQRLRFEVGKLADELEQIRKQGEQ